MLGTFRDQHPSLNYSLDYCPRDETPDYIFFFFSFTCVIPVQFFGKKISSGWCIWIRLISSSLNHPFPYFLSPPLNLFTLHRWFFSQEFFSEILLLRYQTVSVLSDRYRLLLPYEPLPNMQSPCFCLFQTPQLRSRSQRYPGVGVSRQGFNFSETFDL